ncbi:MAG: SulP family inorganic anion transporter [Pseudomonadales bacterium]|nr:SulP family inorganic anion transporter [Pseudomonadales bacterium]
MNYSVRILAGDVFGGVTAAVVMLPASLAFGIASGLGAEAGLYGAVGVGLFAAIFGGTKTQISGPTGPMTVAVAVIVASHATTIVEALTIVAMSGCIQVVLGLTRIGRYIVYTPQSVISGFMSGIGVIIILIQLLPLIGVPAMGSPIESVQTFARTIYDVNYSALALATISFIIAAAWPRRLSTYFPGPVVALIVGTALGMFWLTDAPTLGEIPTGMPTFALVVPSTEFVLNALEPALIIALIGSVDSLLVSLVADSVSGTRHKPNRELVGQGIGNIIAGMFGGIAGAGNTLGTLTNLRAGGSTRASGALYGLLLLLLVLGLGEYLSPIPHAVLTGILIKIGIDIIDWRSVLGAHKIPSGFMVVMLITMAITVFIDLVTGVTVGLIAAGMVHARKLEDLELDNVVSVPLLDRQFLDPEDKDLDQFAARVGLVALRGVFTVASSHRLVSTFSVDLKEHEIVIFDLTETIHVDDSSALVIEQLMQVARAEQTEVIVVGMSDTVEDTFKAFDVLRNVVDAWTVHTLDEAREIARSLLASEKPPKDQAISSQSA